MHATYFKVNCPESLINLINFLKLQGYKQLAPYINLEARYVSACGVSGWINHSKHLEKITGAKCESEIEDLIEIGKIDPWER